MLTSRIHSQDHTPTFHDHLLRLNDTKFIRETLLHPMMNSCVWMIPQSFARAYTTSPLSTHAFEPSFVKDPYRSLMTSCVSILPQAFVKDHYIPLWNHAFTCERPSFVKGFITSPDDLVTHVGELNWLEGAYYTRFIREVKGCKWYRSSRIDTASKLQFNTPYPLAINKIQLQTLKGSGNNFRVFNEILHS